MLIFFLYLAILNKAVKIQRQSRRPNLNGVLLRDAQHAIISV